MREREDIEDIEDITGQTGWMYTDLFVGLMVIFLATITFVPVGSIFISNKAVQTYSEIYPTPIAYRYSKFDYAKIKSDIADFEKKSGFNLNVKVVKVEIVGSYNPSSESSDLGINRAITFSNQLVSESNNSQLFLDSVMQLRSAPDPMISNVVVKFTFSRLVQVLPSTK